MILLDTNVLVYSVNGQAPQHLTSLALVKAAIAGAVSGILVPQVLLEWYAIVTGSRRLARPMTPTEAWAWISDIREAVPVLHPPPQALEIVSQLAVSTGRMGPRIYDLFLIAQMRAHGIGEVCTYNGVDFPPALGIVPRTPEQVLAQA